MNFMRNIERTENINRRLRISATLSIKNSGAICDVIRQIYYYCKVTKSFSLNSKKNININYFTKSSHLRFTQLSMC